MDASYEENKRIADEASGADPRARRKAQAELYSSDIKVSGGFLFPSDSVPSLPGVRISAHATPQRAHRRKDCT